MKTTNKLLKISALLIIGIAIVIIITYLISACTKTSDEDMLFDVEPETVIDYTFNGNN